MTVCVQQSQQAEIPAILMVITEAILACVEDWTILDCRRPQYLGKVKHGSKTILNKDY